MKLYEPVEVDLQKFIAKGEFDCIKLGQSKDWIFHNFPNPDRMSDVCRNMSIWQYGNFEFHFENDLLYLIWCDDFNKLTAGSDIKLQKWILENHEKLTLDVVVTVFNQNKYDYVIVHNNILENAVIRMLKSNVDLLFTLIDEKEYGDINDSIFILEGFGLTHENYRQKLY